MTITITGDAKIKIGAIDITDHIKEGITSINGLGVNIENKCQHKSDGINYSSGNPMIVEGKIIKCIKCGEFYR